MGVKTNAGVDVQVCSLALTTSVGLDSTTVLTTLAVQVASSVSSSLEKKTKRKMVGDERSGNNNSGTTTTTTTATTTNITLDNEASLQAGLQALSLESGHHLQQQQQQERDSSSSAPEGIDSSGVVVDETRSLSSPPELSRQADTNPGPVDYIIPAHHQQAQHHQHQHKQADFLSGSCELLRPYDPNPPPPPKLHEYRPPPSLQLPDQTVMESEFASIHHHHHHHLHQSTENEYTAGSSSHHHLHHHNFSLPATLAVSPSCHAMSMSPSGGHCNDGKVLDPNAREYTPSPSEYTPSPSPCPSPGLPYMALPAPYSLDPSSHVYTGGVDTGRVVAAYGPADFASGSVILPYGNGASMGFAPVSGAPSPAWENLGMADMGHPVAAAAAAAAQSGGGAASHNIMAIPPVGIGQPLQPHHHTLRTYTSMQPFMSMGLPTGPSGALVSHPTITGREHVSRAILLNGVAPDMDDVQLKTEMEQWGPVRAIGSERRNEGLVTVHYYDLRHAKDALRDIQQQHLNKQQRMQYQFQQSQKHQQQQQRGGGGGGGGGGACSSREQQHTDLQAFERQDAGKHLDTSSNVLVDSNIVVGGSSSSSSSSTTTTSCTSSTTSSSSTRGLIGGTVMWAQYTVPVGAAAGPDGLNQGTLVVFNLDVETTMDQLKVVFEAHGAVKELRETPAKKQHKFVEFFDVRDAARALKALDGTEIGGKRVKIEFSRPGGQAHKARVQAQQAQTQQQNALFPISSSRPTLPGAGGPVGGQPMFLGWNGDTGGAAPLTLPHGGHPFYLASLGSIAGGTPMAPIGMVQPQHWNSAAGQLQPFPYATMHGGPQSPGQPVMVVGGAEPLPYGRAPARAISMAYSGPASPAEPFNNCQGFGRPSGNVGQGRGDAASGRRKRNVSVNGNGGAFGKVDSSQPGGKLSMRDSPRCGKAGLTSRCSSRDPIPAQYIFVESEVQANETSKTTLMIKNIPNKYSQAMLLQLLDQHCLFSNSHLEPKEPESAYDFVYLPIDFKNRCNLGYAFVNFTTVQATYRLYKAFHAQQWEAFNSRKVCHVTYARVQGLAALMEHCKNYRIVNGTDGNEVKKNDILTPIYFDDTKQGRIALEEHFKNSRFACDTDDYLPLIFRPPRNGKNSSIPATVAAVHQSSRVLTNNNNNSSSSSSSNNNNSSQEDHSRVPRNGERASLGNGNSQDSTAQDLDMGVAGGQPRASSSSSSGGHRSSNMPQQQHR